MPEGNQYAIAPVNHDNAFLFLQSTHNVSGHFLRMHQHGIVFAVVQEPGGHESRTDVCKPDGKFLDVSQLLQRIDVRVLERLVAE